MGTDPADRRREGLDPKLYVKRRPSVWQWLYYSFGGGLPPDLSQWVLHDTTSRTWWLRQLLRSVLQMSPLVLAVMLFLPTSLSIRLYTCVLGLATGLFNAVFFMWGTTEHRLVKAGFAPGVGEQVREERAARDADHRHGQS